MSEETALSQRTQEIQLSRRGVQVTSVQDLFRMSRLILASRLAPSGLDTEAKITVSIMAGLEVGLPPWQAIRNSAVINGRHSFYGEAVIAIANAAGLIDRNETFTGEGDNLKAVCRCRRRLADGTVTEGEGEFSWAEATRAKLIGKDNWKLYPRDMLMWKARHRAIRPLFADVLAGVEIFEDAQDYPPQMAEPAQREMPSMASVVSLPPPDAPEPPAPAPAEAATRPPTQPRNGQHGDAGALDAAFDAAEAEIRSAANVAAVDYARERIPEATRQALGDRWDLLEMAFDAKRAELEDAGA